MNENNLLNGVVQIDTSVVKSVEDFNKYLDLELKALKKDLTLKFKEMIKNK
jgi:hypothetical protein